MHREREKRPGPLFTGGVVSTPNQQHHGGREDVNGRKVLIGRDCVSPDMRHVEKHDLYLKRAAKPGGPPSAPTINSLRRTQSSGRRRRSRTLTNHEVFALTSIATGTAFAAAIARYYPRPANWVLKHSNNAYGRFLAGLGRYFTICSALHYLVPGFVNAFKDDGGAFPNSMGSSETSGDTAEDTAPRPAAIVTLFSSLGNLRILVGFIIFYFEMVAPHTHGVVINFLVLSSRLVRIFIIEGMMGKVLQRPNLTGRTGYLGLLNIWVHTLAHVVGVGAAIVLGRSNEGLLKRLVK